MMDPYRDLSPLLSPRNIAVVGASERRGSPGRIVLENLHQLNYPGNVYAVHPERSEVLGFPCYPDLDSLPGPVDSVAVLLAAEQVLTVLEAAASIGARAAWVLASGFAEAGTEGKALQDELALFAEDTGLLVCGPNSIGVANLVDNVATYSAALSPAMTSGRVSAVVQSGAICMGLANAARFGFRCLISSGNEAILGSGDFIEHFVADPHTEVIIAFLEGIRDPKKFAAAAERAAEAGKPILLVKVGRSEAARQSVQAHTGKLAGSDEVFNAILRRLGVVRLASLDELIETAELFLTCPLPNGGGIGLISLSGGQLGLISDLAEGLRLAFPEFSNHTRKALRGVLPAYSPIINPLDAWGSGDLERTYPACVEIVSKDDSISLLALSRDTPPNVSEREIEQSKSIAEAAMAAASGSSKPTLLFSNLSTGVDERIRRVLQPSTVPYLQGTQETLHALKAFIEYASFRRQREKEVVRGCPTPASLEAWRSKLEKTQGALPAVEVRKLLREYSIPGPKEDIVGTEEEAVAAAEAIGYPVVLKLSAANIRHKTEIGGVKPGLSDADELRQAYRGLIEIVGRLHQTETPPRVLVQEMVASGVEVLLGMVQDEDFGHVLVFGSGGVLVELLEDSSMRIPPVSRHEALDMMGETRVAALLAGFRGRPEADVEALAGALVRFSQIAVDLGEFIYALEINPLMVLPKGAGVQAVDALLESGTRT
jgi:acetyltransferase